MVSPVTEATYRCRSCGNDLRAKARFCDVCGSPIAPRPATGEHKQVTVLFADVVGSMKLAAALDTERTPRDHERAVQPGSSSSAAVSRHR
jgi:adenylate cyclase